MRSIWFRDAENRKEKGRKKDGFAQQSSSFALYFIEFAELSRMLLILIGHNPSTVTILTI
ncbi:hypothetical protein SO802_013713 [Lithocarpus litseifolius]|uniref:Uncharacterized protein n=1 Tax=Lithocarpus litseifolius TaxID=425828 RepID=A0AAW2D8I6_9ROSI